MLYAEGKPLPHLFWKLPVGLFLLTAAPPGSVSGLDVDVWTCADIHKVNRALLQDHVTARFRNLTCTDSTTVVAYEADEERELRIEALLAPGDLEEGQLPPLFLDGIRFDVGQGAGVIFAADVFIFRSASNAVQSWRGGHGQV